MFLVKVCSNYYILQVPLFIDHNSFIHKHCMKVVLGVLNSSDVILSSLQTAHRMKGGKVTTIDWWLLDSIVHTLEGLLVLCIIEGGINCCLLCHCSNLYLYI